MEPDFYVYGPRPTKEPPREQLGLDFTDTKTFPPGVELEPWGFPDTDISNTTASGAVDNSPTTNPASNSTSLVVEAERIETVRESNATKHRADIERGKPVAVAVANRDGKVTAETFREEASRRRVTFDSDTGDQRGLCWIPVLFAELCREGKLDLRRHPNGKPDKEYSKAQHNDQNVYLPRIANQETAA